MLGALRLSVVLSRHDCDGMSADVLTERLRTRGLSALALGPADVVRRAGTYVIVQLWCPGPDVDRVLASRTTERREAFAESSAVPMAGSPGECHAAQPSFALHSLGRPWSGPMWTFPNEGAVNV